MLFFFVMMVEKFTELLYLLLFKAFLTVCFVTIIVKSH